MKKKLLYVVCIALLLSVGCASPSKENKEPEKEVGTVGKEEPEKEPESEKGEEEPEVTQPEAVQVRIFHVNDETGEIQDTEVEIAKLDAMEIWSQLLVLGPISEGSRVNGFKVDEADARKGVLDIDENTGNYIRSMGTLGEQEIVTCLVNTYAYAYGCERIQITENGEILETGHASLDGYIERQ